MNPQHREKTAYVLRLGLYQQQNTESIKHTKHQHLISAFQHSFLSDIYARHDRLWARGRENQKNKINDKKSAPNSNFLWTEEKVFFQVTVKGGIHSI